MLRGAQNLGTFSFATDTTAVSFSFVSWFFSWFFLALVVEVVVVVAWSAWLGRSSVGLIADAFEHLSLEVCEAGKILFC